MAIDIPAIDRAIAKLQELRRLASDPEIAPFLRGDPEVSLTAKKEADNSLAGAVMIAAATLQRDFTVNDIAEQMTENKYEFRGTEPRKSVANALRALSRDGFIKVKENGKGRRETVFWGLK